MKKVLLVVKNGNKTYNKRKNINSLNSKRGSELAQTILITAIMVVIIATLFFPQMQNLFTTSMTKITSWFNGVLNTL